MEDLIKQLSEVNEDSPAFDGLMLRLERTLNSDFGSGSIEDEEFDSFWNEMFDE
jgi:hypothetical protein